MDKRHPSSFQQLEKLGEGTYATVCVGRNMMGIRGSYVKTSYTNRAFGSSSLLPIKLDCADSTRSSKVEIDRPESW
jgi:hypothetical protein